MKYQSEVLKIPKYFLPIIQSYEEEGLNYYIFFSLFQLNGFSAVKSILR